MTAPVRFSQMHSFLVWVSRFGHMGSPLLAMAVALLVTAVALLGMNVTLQQKNYEAVQGCNAELLQISEVDKRLMGLELTVRGFALTDDERFITYYKSELQQIRAALAALSRDMDDDPPSVQRALADLKTAVKKRLADLEALVELGPGQAQVVAVAIRNKDYRATMYAARAKVADLKKIELQELSDRQAYFVERTNATFVEAVAIVFAAFVLGAAGVFLLKVGRAFL